MRHPFYMDHLDPDDQSTVRRWYFGIVVFYSSLALLSLLVGAAMVDVADFHVNTMRRQTSAGTAAAYGSAAGPILLEPIRRPDRFSRSFRIALSPIPFK